MVGTAPERLGVADDEVAVAEGFQDVVELIARGTEKLGALGGKVPGVEGSALVGRVSQEPACSRRSTGAPRRRGLGRSRALGLCELDCAARECLLVVLKLLGGCWSAGGVYL